MKMSLGKKFTLILSLVLLIPIIWYQGDAVANAATPTFSKSKIEIVGVEETYQLEIKNQVKGSTYKWTSSKTKVAKVSSKGMVTTVNKGTSTITCKITYPNKKTKTITCKVTVVVPATGVKINNTVLKNGAHTLLVGESFNFNRDIEPTNSSDKTYWTISGGDVDSLRVDNNSNGIVTALKPGKVILKAIAVKSFSSKDIADSIVDDAVIIEVVGPKAAVNSADISGSTEIKVVFDSPVDQSTIIGADGKLLDSIEVSMRKNVKGVLAKDPGALKATLSTDFKTLIITSTNMFEGEYGINFTNKIKTVAGVAIESYYKQLTYTDTIPPTITGVSLDDSGVIVNIRFNEAIDFSGMKVSNATLLPTSGLSTNVDQSTYSILNNRLNYIPSEDKKSLMLNLSKIVTSDFGKHFSITISGVKDLSGNIPVNYTLTAVVYTDTTPKPQAALLSVVRSSYNTLTANFSRSIEYAGWANVNNGVSMNGVVDPKDPKKVNYTLNNSDASLTGVQSVYVGFWDAYNVISGDMSADQMHERKVNFTTDKTNPMLLKYEFSPEDYILTLTYNKDVSLNIDTGIFISTLVTVTDEIRPGNNISYKKIESGDEKVIKLLMSNMTLMGDYTFILDQGFALDSYRNPSLSRSVTISNAGSSSNELPGPYAIVQSTTNLSQIYLEFANMLDVPTAVNPTHYSIPGVQIVSAQVTKNTKDNGATVMLTVVDGSIDVTVERPITIVGLRGYNGSFSEMTAYTTMVELKDNKRPFYIAPPIYDKNSLNVIQLNFSEAIQGTMRVKVTEIGTNGNGSYDISNSVSIIGNSVYITLNNIPARGAYLKIDILENNITDLNGNQVLGMNPQIGVAAVY